MKNILTVAALAVGVWFSLSAPCRAQITTYTDEHGKMVFINANANRRPAPARSTISPPAAVAPAAALESSQKPPQPRVPAIPATVTSVAAETPQAIQPEARMERIVREAAERHKVDPALVKAVITTESGWNSRAVSPKGAVGLMQLIPATAQRYGVGNSFDPAQNVEGGTTYLKWLLDRYKGDLSKTLAAYNAGEHAVDLIGGVPAYRETQQYVRKVTNTYFRSDPGRDATLWSAPRPLVRQELDSKGRTVFTNE